MGWHMLWADHAFSLSPTCISAGHPVPLQSRGACASRFAKGDTSEGLASLLAQRVRVAEVCRPGLCRCPVHCPLACWLVAVIAMFDLSQPFSGVLFLACWDWDSGSLPTFLNLFLWPVE